MGFPAGTGGIGIPFRSWVGTESSPFFAPGRETADRLVAPVETLRRKGDSCGTRDGKRLGKRPGHTHEIRGDLRTWEDRF